MSQLNCLDVERALWRYVDRELPASEVVAVSEHLGGCEACRRLHHERAREANVCRGILASSAPGSESARRIVAAMHREGLLTQSPGEARRAEAAAPHSFGPARKLALAAVCLIAATLGLGLFFRVDSTIGLGTFEADGVVGRCVAGNSFVVPESALLTVRLEDPENGDKVGASLEVKGPAELTLDARSTSRRFSAALSRGLLKAEVRPRRGSGESFEIRTPEAIVTVVGTGFLVDATVDGETRLEVSHGVVAFRAIGAEEVRVTPEMGPRVVRRGDRAPSVPTPPSPISSVQSPRESEGTSAVPSDPAGDGAEVGVDAGDTSRPVIEPSLGTPGTSDGPTLGKPGGSVGLDQVANPRREQKDE